MSTAPHLAPNNCFICGSPEDSHTDSDGHVFWSNAAADAEARAADARTNVTYANGATTAEGSYVAEHRPY